MIKKNSGQASDRITNESINIDLARLYAKKSFYEAKIEDYKEMVKRTNVDGFAIKKGLENLWENLLKTNDEIRLTLEYKQVVFSQMRKVAEEDAKTLICKGDQ